MRGTRLIAATVILLAVTTPVAAQRTLDVPSKYAKIQAAIDAAKNGDTVLVAPGTYVENIDFKGKAIVVRSSQGPEVTTIDGGKKASVVRFVTNEDVRSVLHGFTIMRGSSAFGGGIHCWGAAPTISGNIVRDNEAVAYGYARGGGIDCYHSGEAVIVGNLVCFNVVRAHAATSTLSALASGGGIAIGGMHTLAMNNLVYRNTSEQVGSTLGSAEAGGIASFNARSLSNTVVFNLAKDASGFASGGGIEADFYTEITNCIVWGNVANRDPQIPSSAPVTFSCVQGGRSGFGNIAKDPAFIDAAGDDFHLRADSPCRDAGWAAFCLPTTDLEGDPRVAGRRPDIGADEFHAHLYWLGKATPGGRITIGVIGEPTSPAYLAFGTRLLTTPATIPGLSGSLHLDPAALQGLLSLGSLPITGSFRLHLPLDPNLPKMTIHLQALVGTRLTNPETVQIR